MSATKPFEIPKTEVWQAYLEVKSNGGAAGVDEQSLEAFEQDLKGDLSSPLESDEFRNLFPTPSESRTNTEAKRGYKSPGSADRG